MSLDLDKRQRAMLLEMGVRVWQPLASVAPAVAHSVAQAPGNLKIAPLADTSSFRSPAEMQENALWHLGDAQALYGPATEAGGACWLVLAETPASALHSPVFEGNAGRLLDNMLRAARLNRAGAVLFAPVLRHVASEATDAMSTDLSTLIAQTQPAVVLIMGRLAALALLQSGEPFGKLRGRVHALQGRPTVVTYDAAYLLRVPADKAKAWDDLCLALSLTTATIAP